MIDLFRTPDNKSALRIIPMGGCGEFGMNITAYLFEGRLFVVDCGLRFAEQTKLGIDAVIPAVDPWFAAAGGVYSYIITHGHEDHIGALPHIVPRWPAPIYATPWTAALIRMKFVKHGLEPDKYQVIVVEAGDKVRAGGFEAEYVHVNHSIPNACALFIRTPRFNLFHTGDFKYEADPIIEPAMDLQKLAALGKEGVHLLLADSTNAERAGMSPGEKTVREPLVKIFKYAPAAVLVTTFSSNLWRIKSIVDACIESGRKLFITGTGLDNTLAIAKELGIYDIPDGIRVLEANVDDLPRSHLVVLATGCQGESRAALARIAFEEHRSFKVGPDDTVVLSSRVIPGNEKAMLQVLNQFKRTGARIVTASDEKGIHVSGHAYQGDMKLLFDSLKPRHFTPVHGAFSQLRANLDHGVQNAGQSILIENGDVIDVDEHSIQIVGQIEVDSAFVDADSSVILSYEAVRERLRIGELGCAVLTGVIQRHSREWLVKPAVDFQGIRLPYGVNPDSWTSEWTGKIASIVRTHLTNPAMTDEAILEEARIMLRRALNHALRKKPIVLCKLHIV